MVADCPIPLLTKLLPLRCLLGIEAIVQRYYSRGAFRFIHNYIIVQIFIVELVAIVGGWRGFVSSLRLSLGKLDGIIFQFYKGICGQRVQIIIVEEVLSVVVPSHSIESSLGKYWTLPCNYPSLAFEADATE